MELRDDGRKYDELRIPDIKFIDNSLVYQTTDVNIIARLSTSSSFKIQIQPYNSQAKEFLSTSIAVHLPVQVNLVVNQQDNAIISHLVNATTILLMYANVPQNGLFSASCDSEASKFDGPESCVYLACGGGDEFIYGKRISSLEVIEKLRLKCQEMREIVRQAIARHLGTVQSAPQGTAQQ